MPPIDPQEALISEPIQPLPGSFDPAGMARGEPGLPRVFTWRKQQYTVARLLETWCSYGDDRGRGGGERYLRKHWFRVETTEGKVMTLYFDRQPLRGRGPVKGRWTLYSMGRDQEPESY